MGDTPLLSSFPPPSPLFSFSPSPLPHPYPFFTPPFPFPFSYPPVPASHLLFFLPFPSSTPALLLLLGSARGLRERCKLPAESARIF